MRGERSLDFQDKKVVKGQPRRSIDQRVDSMRTGVVSPSGEVGQRHLPRQAHRPFRRQFESPQLEALGLPSALGAGTAE
jgi:hypothetical protein